MNRYQLEGALVGFLSVSYTHLCDLVARTYHHAKVQVKAGDKVKRGQVIAQYGNTGANTTGPHLHIEFDTDTKFPTLAYGVSVTANNRIINTLAEYKRAGGLADSTIDPDDVWFVGEGQTIKGYSGCLLYTSRCV